MKPDGTDKFQLQTKHLELMKESLRVLFIEYGYELHEESSETFLNQGYLPDGFVEVKSLRLLSFDHYGELKRLPESFGNLSALKMLNLIGSGINGLPNSFGLLSRLEELDMSQCAYLESLPQSFSHLSRLKKLNMSGCSRLSRLPDGFGQLKSLTYLHIYRLLSHRRYSYTEPGRLSRYHTVVARACMPVDDNGEKHVYDYKLDTSDVEEFKDIAGGFRKFFFPLRQMEKFAHHYYVEE